MEAKKVTVSALVDAGPGKVWDYWNKPEHITKWNFADPSWHCPSSENDLRPGGKLKSRMEAKDGSFGFDFEVVYDEVIDQKKISYTMGDTRRAETTFEDQDGKTLVTTIFDTEDENAAEMQQKGWQAILNNFKQYTESN